MTEFDGQKACTPEDAELFYVTGEEKQNPSRWQQEVINDAKEICGGCDVRLACLDKALENDEPYGIWGGKTSYERRQIKRKYARVALRGTQAKSA
jgi:hypothetical protein